MDPGKVFGIINVFFIRFLPVWVVFFLSAPTQWLNVIYK